MWSTVAGRWIAYGAVVGAVIFFMAPDSWWQFGVAPVNERKAALDFSLQSIEGGTWRFSEHRGKVVVVNYWATWCPPCRIETPGLVAFENDYVGRGVEFVGVTVDEDIDTVRNFVEDYQITYPILNQGFDPNIVGDGMALPTTFLYDRKGHLAKKYTGIVLESTLRSDVELLLNEPNP